MQAKLRKPLYILMAVCLLLSLLAIPAYASDIGGHWAEDTLSSWVQSGWLSGYGDGNYRPNGNITRAEFVTIVNRILSYTDESENVSAYSDVFPNDWYYPEFAKALKAGYIQGSDGKLSPNDPITRNEAVTIISRIAALDSGADYSAVLANVADGRAVPTWAAGYVGAAISAGYITGVDNKFEGSRNITRAEAVVLLDRYNSGTRVFAFAGTYGDLSANNVTVTAGGVNLANMVIDGDLVIAESVGDGTVDIDNVTVNGSLDIKGGGSESVYIKNSKIAEVIVTKKAVHVVMKDGTVVTTVTVAGENPSVEIGNGAKIEKITIAEDAVNTNIKIDSGATIANLDVGASNVNVALENGAEVTNLTVSESAQGAAIDTKNGSKIGTITLNAAAEVKGGGTITNANVNAEGVKIESTPTNTNVADNVTADVGGKETSGGKTDTGSGGSTGGGGGGGGGTTKPSDNTARTALDTQLKASADRVNVKGKGIAIDYSSIASGNVTVAFTGGADTELSSFTGTGIFDEINALFGSSTGSCKVTSVDGYNASSLTAAISASGTIQDLIDAINGKAIKVTFTYSGYTYTKDYNVTITAGE